MIDHNIIERFIHSTIPQLVMARPKEDLWYCFETSSDASVT